MCGIIGRINYRGRTPVREAELKKPLFEMFHRGPDDEGIFIDRYCGLAMRRLSIIDVAGGRQPMLNETGEIAVVLNGEIYNYRELRKELEPRHRFKTNSDTEVLVHLYEEHGERMPGMLNGMFGFVLWDAKKEILLAARDPLGVKPLFYAEQNGALAVASEIRAILAALPLSREMDRAALTEYLSFYYISAPRTIFKQVKRLPQGHYLLAKDGGFELKRYWRYEFAPEKMNEAEAAERLETALLNSVRRQMMSEVPLGVFLSSGLDSTAIVAMMAKLGVTPKTYTVGYESGSSFDEMAGAKLVAGKYGTDHHDCVMKPAHIKEFLPKIIGHLAEPHGDWTHVAMYYLSQQSRGDITVALTGAGGDELFAGYPTLTAAKFGRFYRHLPGPVKTALKAAADSLPPSYERLSLDFKIKAFTRGAGFAPEMAHMKYKEIFSSGEIAELLPGAEGDPFEVFKQHLPDLKGVTTLNRLMYLDMNVFLPYCSLHATDMATMINSQ
ncbi:MAG: asparagine synthase (glutamine-hydrolyzing), partial [Elusimicrobia bacterium RIFOXYA12_FULL_57_11]